MRKPLLASLAAIGLSLATGSALSAQDDPFDSARSAIVRKDNASALTLLDSGVFPVNQANDEGWTLLHFAAEANNLDMVKTLLERGADPKLKTKWGSTPLDVASATMVKAAIAKAVQTRSAGAASAPQSSSSPPAAAAISAATYAPAASRGSNGMCAAIRAEKVNDGRSATLRPWLRGRDDVWYDHPDELALLLEDCVDANYQDGEARTTLLHHAAQRDRVEVAKVLLAHGANPNLRNREGERPGDLAKSPEMTTLLGPRAAPKPGPDASTPRQKECLAKREADAALCSDMTCRLRTLNKQQQCLSTGLYY